jgi:AP-2 complex subunit alpha
MSLLLSMVAASAEGWESAAAAVVTLLAKIRRNERNFAAGYTYFQIPAPWLQVKCMRLLQYFPPSDNPHVSKLLDRDLTGIITETDISKKNHNKINALHSIFFEAISLVNHMRSYDTAAASGSSALLLKAVDHLGSFLTAETSAQQNKNLKLCNVRYLALDTLSRIAVIPGSAQHLKPFTDSFIAALEDEDMGIRRRALDVLYEMAERATAARIVARLLEFLADAEDDVREELVLKVAILAERWATKFDWYVDVILRLIQVAGPDVSDDIWHRVVYIVTNNERFNPGLHKYAASEAFAAVSLTGANENMVKIAAYLLGEFGHHIAEDPDCSFHQQFETLRSKFGLVSRATQAILLNTFMKLRAGCPALAPKVDAVLRENVAHIDQELQQRATEYLLLERKTAPELLGTVFDAMDFFPDRGACPLHICPLPVTGSHCWRPSLADRVQSRRQPAR